jgi:hypothetical protein
VNISERICVSKLSANSATSQLSLYSLLQADWNHAVLKENLSWIYSLAFVKNFSSSDFFQLLHNDAIKNDWLNANLLSSSSSVFIILQNPETPRTIFCFDAVFA